jgi:hypothetical protein
MLDIYYLVYVLGSTVSIVTRFVYMKDRISFLGGDGCFSSSTAGKILDLPKYLSNKDQRFCPLG